MNTPDQHITQSAITYSASGAGVVVWLTDPAHWIVILTIILLSLQITLTLRTLIRNRKK